MLVNNELQLDLCDAAERLAHRLAEQQLRIVFAESCTAGLVSATLAQVPGISQWHCGSAVTYREATKTAWLNVPETEIDQHNVVSANVAEAMARGVLENTPEANISASITGHLGPDAPTVLDGVVHIAIARRQDGEVTLLSCREIMLEITNRPHRQREAALHVLRLVADTLSP